MNAGNDFLGLTGRVCVVTGAGSGIGRAIALGFAQQGASVAAIDRDADGCAETVAQIAGSGGRAVAVACDVADAASVSAAAQRTLEAFGDCDVLVNCAGILGRGGLDELTLEQWSGMIAVNLTGTFLCSRTFGRQMRRKGKGALVHLASVVAAHPAPNAGAYSVTKAGVAMLSQQFAIEWGVHGIRSNSVSPGMTLTPMTQASFEHPGLTERRSKIVPAGRIGTPTDIANAVLFLASDRSDYITGVDLTVDGGWTRNLMTLVPRATD